MKRKKHDNGRQAGRKDGRKEGRKRKEKQINHSGCSMKSQ
jgi:flagellar biosynthesis/type III secretory pathway protein FliH